MNDANRIQDRINDQWETISHLESDHEIRAALRLCCAEWTDKTFDAAYHLAYEKGHANGASEIICEFQDLIELIEVGRDQGRGGPLVQDA